MDRSKSAFSRDWLSAALVCAVLFLIAASTASAQPSSGEEPPKAAPAPIVPEVTRAKIVFNKDQQLLTPSEEEEYVRSKKLTNLKVLLKDGKVRGVAAAQIAEGARYLVFRLTMERHQESLTRILAEIGRIIGLAKGGARELLLEELTARATDLFDNNYRVRVNAVLLLSQLNSKAASLRLKTPAVAYAPAAKALLAFIKDPGQRLGPKINAVVGIQRILTSNDSIARDVQVDVATTLSSQLREKKTPQTPRARYWYEVRLAETLGTAPYVYDSFSLNKKPIVVDSLLATVNDRTRHYYARSAAAKALGRAALDKSTDVDQVVSSIVGLGADMVNAYNKFPSQQWIGPFWNLYAAFQPQNALEKDQKAGLLLKFTSSQPVQDGYREVLPLLQFMLDSYPPPRGKAPAKFNKERVDRLKDWLQKHQQVDTAGTRPAAGPN